MPALTTDDGVKLHYEEAGSGTPIVFVHEFAGDGYGARATRAPRRLRSGGPQVNPKIKP